MELLSSVSGQTRVLCVLQECAEWHFSNLLCLVRVGMDCKLEQGGGWVPWPLPQVRLVSHSST